MFEACLIATSRIAPTAGSGVSGSGVGYTFIEHILSVMSHFFNIIICFYLNMLWVFGALVYGLRPLVARPQGRPSFDECWIATSRIAPTV